MNVDYRRFPAHCRWAFAYNISEQTWLISRSFHDIIDHTNHVFLKTSKSLFFFFKACLKVSHNHTGRKVFCHSINLSWTSGHTLFSPKCNQHLKKLSHVFQYISSCLIFWSLLERIPLRDFSPSGRFFPIWIFFINSAVFLVKTSVRFLQLGRPVSTIRRRHRIMQQCY